MCSGNDYLLGLFLTCFVMFSGEGREAAMVSVCRLWSTVTRNRAGQPAISRLLGVLGERAAAAC